MNSSWNIATTNLSENAATNVEKYRDQLRNKDIDDLRRLLDPQVNPPRDLVPAMKRAAEELIEEKQLNSISAGLRELLVKGDFQERPKRWRAKLKSISEAQILLLANDVDFITPHRWALSEAEVELNRRRRRREDARYWITTAIAVIALVFSGIALSGD